VRFDGLSGLFLRAGKAGTILGARADLLRSTGPRAALRELREDAVLGAEGGDPIDSFYRRIWGEAASELGAEVRDLSSGFLEISKGEARTRVWRQEVMLDDEVTLRLAADKPLAHRLLLEAGVPVPEHVEFELDDLATPLSFLKGDSSPCAVKPAAGTDRGTGVTCGVRDRADLLRARLCAARWGRRLLIERQLAGEVYRLLFLDGELLDAVRRSPPRVVGDGRSTVADLIAAENRRRLAAGGAAGLSLLRIDLDCLFTLREAGLSLRSVPSPGVEARVKTVANQNRLEDNETVRDLSDELVGAARAAAAAIGLRLAGVDVIAADALRPLSESGGVVVEVNGTPGFNQHYQVADPERATRVAVPILRKLLGAQ
jgi:cyanophycin synthetase